MAYQSVVKVYTTTQSPDYDAPWMAGAPSSATGSGVVIGENLVLTGAHVVANATFVQIQKLNEPTKSVAQVVSVSHDLDLALLKANSPEYLDDVEAAKIGQLPNIQQRVSVIGYPVGGEEVSLTEGVVSRIEVQEYAHSQRLALAITVDAAINEGNSGGPVVDGDELIGIAFQTRDGAENIGEIVPTPLINHFLEAYHRQKSTALPALNVRTQRLENPIHRECYKLGRKDGGVLVVSVGSGGSCDGYLEVGDVVLKVDGLSVAENGTVLYRGRYRTRFDVLLGDHHVDDTLHFEVLRNGQVAEVLVPLKAAQSLVPGNQYDTMPSYLIFGGLVFQALTLDFLEVWEDWWQRAPRELVYLYNDGMATDQRQGIVICSQILSDEINVGYNDFIESVIESVNDVVVRNLQHFAKLLDSTDGVVKLRTTQGGVIVFNASEARLADKNMIDRYRIPALRSSDL